MFDLMLSIAGTMQRPARSAELAKALLEGVHAQVMPLFPARVRTASGKAAALEDVLSKPENFALRLKPKSKMHAQLEVRVEAAHGDFRFELTTPSSEPLLFAEQFSMLERVFTEFAGDILVAPYGGASVRNLPFTRIKPPLDHVLVDESSLIDVVDQRVADNALARMFAEQTLPDGARRAQIGSITLIDWNVNGRDVARSLTTRNAWLHQHAIGSVKPGWNRDGDVKVTPVGAIARAPLTLHSPVMEVGYVAVHSGTSAGAQRAALEHAAAMKRAGTLDDGSVLKNVFIVADGKRQAIAMQPEAETLGLKVLYADDNDFWDPSPDGDWISAV